MQEWTPFKEKLQCQREEPNKQYHYAVAIVKRTAECAENQGIWPWAGSDYPLLHEIVMLAIHAQNTNSNTPTVTIYDCMKMTVDNQSVPVNISDMHFEDKPPNLMNVNFPAIRYIIKYVICYTICMDY